MVSTRVRGSTFIFMASSTSEFAFLTWLPLAPASSIAASSSRSSFMVVLELWPGIIIMPPPLPDAAASTMSLSTMAMPTPLR